MRRFMVLFVVVAVVFIATLMASPVPGRVKHRIHVPTKVHTVFVTKFIKVPEHHHHHHVIKKEQHHHHHKTPQLTHHKLSKYHNEESVFEEDNFDHDSGI